MAQTSQTLLALMIFSVDVYFSENCDDELLAPDSILLYAKGGNKPKTQPFTYVDIFPEKTGSDFSDRLFASVPVSMEVEPGIFVNSMNNGTGQSTTQSWYFSLVYRKIWTIVLTIT